MPTIGGDLPSRPGEITPGSAPGTDGGKQTPIDQPLKPGDQKKEEPKPHA